MYISTCHQDLILTDVYGVPIEFDVRVLNMILGTRNKGLNLYTSRKELQFSNFLHVEDVCSLPLRFQFICLQV